MSKYPILRPIKNLTPPRSIANWGGNSPQSISTRLLIAFSGGALMGFTPAPVNAWFLAWVGLAPLWILLMLEFGTSRPRLFSRTSSYALVWGIGYHGLALAWIRDLHPLTWMGVPWLASVAITVFCWLFITLWGAGLVVLWAWLWHCCSTWMARGQPDPCPHQVAVRVLFGTAIWCGLEALWGQGALYWTSLSYTQSPVNLAILHLGQISGPLTVTAAIVSCNGLLAESWLRFRSDHAPGRRSTQSLVGASLSWLVGLHLVGFLLYSQPLQENPTQLLKIGLIQGNIPTRIKLFEEGLRQSVDRYGSGYERLVAEGVDAVLTPEGALPWLWVNNPAANPLYRSIQQQQVPAWVGTVGLRQNRVTQTLFSIDGNGEWIGRYDKVKLVPLGEYIPFEAVLGQIISRLSPLGSSMVPGRMDQTLQTPFGQVIAGICYESAFPDLFRRQAATGGQFILTASNNDPYGAAMMAQHHAQDVMRSIETDRWAVRATNTGFSGIVNPHGETQWLSGFRTYETHAHSIYRRQTQTLYVRWGNWLTPTLLIGAGCLAVQSRFKSRFKSSSPH
ncbi:MAG: apolipoprotein N-acyltransferase [Elainella sp. Prado103]|nr:apolipoprotein N-acyltransferase [Elainella sp. Prado103]